VAEDAAIEGAAVSALHAAKIGTTARIAAVIEPVDPLVQKLAHPSCRQN
jgi:hypothetical protein